MRGIEGAPQATAVGGNNNGRRGLEEPKQRRLMILIHTQTASRRQTINLIR